MYFPHHKKEVQILSGRMQVSWQLSKAWTPVPFLSCHFQLKLLLSSWEKAKNHVSHLKKGETASQHLRHTSHSSRFRFSALLGNIELLSFSHSLSCFLMIFERQRWFTLTVLVVSEQRLEDCWENGERNRAWDNVWGWKTERGLISCVKRYDERENCICPPVRPKHSDRSLDHYTFTSKYDVMSEYSSYTLHR